MVRVGDLAFRDVVIRRTGQDEQGAKTALVTACKDFTAQRTIVEATGEDYATGDLQQAPTMLIELEMVESAAGRWVVADGRILENSCSG